jgi:hypothetical protein
MLNGQKLSVNQQISGSKLNRQQNPQNMMVPTQPQEWAHPMMQYAKGAENADLVNCLLQMPPSQQLQV